jgi:uncharacterized membrane protein YesL
MLALRVLWRRIGLLLAANVIWLGMSLLIVTWPAATAGLFYLIHCVVNEELTNDYRPAVIDDFWKYFREHWRRSSLLSVGNLVIILAIGLALRFYGESTIVPLSWLVGPITLIGIAWTGAQFYLYPLLIQRAEVPPWAIAREALLIAISYPLNTFSLLLTALVLSMAAAILAGPILFIFFSFIALLQTIALRAILAQRGEMAALRLNELYEPGKRPRKSR